ncbi:MAG: GNAT family N-acetyltransferase, partial [bacterium]|nr:GNAT family N-acetyltransferase [bacterium]
LCFGLHSSQAQVGFARVVTDYSRMAHIMDVFVVPAHRGRGLGIWLVQCIVDCPCLQGMGMTLATADAHELYRRFGFTGITATESQMRRPQENPWHRPELIRR